MVRLRLEGWSGISKYRSLKGQCGQSRKQKGSVLGEEEDSKHVFGMYMPSHGYLILTTLWLQYHNYLGFTDEETSSVSCPRSYKYKW